MTPRRTTRSSKALPGPGRGRGGAAPRRTPQSTRRTSRTATPAVPEDRRAARARLTGRAAVLALVLMVLAVSYASSARAWIQQRSDINELEAQIAEREAAVAQLEQDRKRWDDPAFVKTQARLRFGWVMPGETGYRVIGDDGEALGGTSQLTAPRIDKPTDEEPAFWETQWGSVLEAGKDPAEERDKDTEPARQPVTKINPNGRGVTGQR